MFCTKIQLKYLGRVDSFLGFLGGGIGRIKHISHKGTYFVRYVLDLRWFVLGLAEGSQGNTHSIKNISLLTPSHSEGASLSVDTRCWIFFLKITKPRCLVLIDSHGWLGYVVSILGSRSTIELALLVGWRVFRQVETETDN